MAVVQVTPLPDGVDQRYGWQVVVNGVRKSRHTTKKAATRKARSLKGPDDQLVISGTNGRFL